MKCPTCVTEGKRSRVTPHGRVTTAAAGRTYYDEDGVLHSHDPNRTDSNYSCTYGHRWTTRTYRTCPAPACGWKLN